MVVRLISYSKDEKEYKDCRFVILCIKGKLQIIEDVEITLTVIPSELYPDSYIYNDSKGNCFILNSTEILYSFIGTDLSECVNEAFKYLNIESIISQIEDLTANIEYKNSFIADLAKKHSVEIPNATIINNNFNVIEGINIGDTIYFRRSSDFIERKVNLITISDKSVYYNIGIDSDSYYVNKEISSNDKTISTSLKDSVFRYLTLVNNDNIWNKHVLEVYKNIYRNYPKNIQLLKLHEKSN